MGQTARRGWTFSAYFFDDDPFLAFMSLSAPSKERHLHGTCPLFFCLLRIKLLIDRADDWDMVVHENVLSFPDDEMMRLMGSCCNKPACIRARVCVYVYVYVCIVCVCVCVWGTCV